MPVLEPVITGWIHSRLLLLLWVRCTSTRGLHSVRRLRNILLCRKFQPDFLIARFLLLMMGLQSDRIITHETIIPKHGGVPGVWVCREL